MKKLQNQLLAIPGIKLSTVEVRSYPYGSATAHLVGYVSGITAEDLENIRMQDILLTA